MHIHSSNHMNRQLFLALLFTCILSSFEYIGGTYTNSLALTADAAHIFLDGFAVVLAWISSTIGRRNQVVRASCTITNGSLLIITSCLIAWETIPAFLQPRTVVANQTLTVAIVSLVMNILILQRLTHGKHDENVRAAALHVLGDMIASIGVIVSSAFVMLTGINRIDSIVAVGVSIYLMSNGWALLQFGTRTLHRREPISIQQFMKQTKEG